MSQDHGQWDYLCWSWSLGRICGVQQGRESRKREETLWNSTDEFWIIVCQFIVSVSSGHFKDTEQVTSIRAGHAFWWCVQVSYSPPPHTALPLSLSWLPTPSALLTCRGILCFLWKEELSNLTLRSPISSRFPPPPPPFQQSDLREILPR